MKQTKTAKTAKKKKGKTEHSADISSAVMPEIKQKNVLIAKVGSVVISTAGRDANNPYMIYSFIDANYVYLVDGKAKKIETPKKKKLKHLKLTGEQLTIIAEKIAAKKIVHDAEIVSALRKLAEEIT